MAGASNAWRDAVLWESVRATRRWSFVEPGCHGRPAEVPRTGRGCDCPLHCGGTHEGGHSEGLMPDIKTDFFQVLKQCGVATTRFGGLQRRGGDRTTYV